VIKFIKDMFSGSGEVSSKRVAGMLALLCAIIGIFAALLSQTAFDSLLMYSATLLSASVVTTIFNKK
jgi:4-hydroxybenzoate polyprenyltransferase